MDRTNIHKATLLRAIENAYEVFSGYRAPDTLDASPGENVPKILADLKSAPLRDLAYEKLDDFEGSALYTLGSLLDYKHFLPRILELILPSDTGSCFYADLVAGKLNYGHLNSWPKDEISAVQDVFSASFHAAFYADPYDSQINNLLVGNIDVGNALALLLPEISNTHGANAARNLAALVVEVTEKMDERSWLGRHLAATDKDVLQKWVRSEKIVEALYGGIDLVASDDVWEIETALFQIGSP